MCLRVVNSLSLFCSWKPGIKYDIKGYWYRNVIIIRCLGTRQLLSEEDECQPNGKIFKVIFSKDQEKKYSYYILYSREKGEGLRHRNNTSRWTYSAIASR